MIPRAARSAGADRLAYGALTLTEGGLWRLPELHFPGGVMIWRVCVSPSFLRSFSAAVVNTAKIKGRTTGCGFPYPLSLPPAAEAAFAAAFHPSPAFTSSTSPATFKQRRLLRFLLRLSLRLSRSVSLRIYSAAFPGAHAHVDLWAVPNVCPASPRASGSQGAFSTPGWKDAPGAGAVEFGTPWEGYASLDDLGRRAGHEPGGGVRFEALPAAELLEPFDYTCSLNLLFHGMRDPTLI
ncbi:hypothetical protein DFH09DRAFT_1316425 [Mycena vulgaris]|nr:hypothetical protein DFH09DRAFT_1316425 [Mycena vulgaris]